MKTAVAIIGATGKMGSAIAKALIKGQYRLLLFSRNRQKLEELYNEIRRTTPSADVEGVNCSTDACWEADIIIPAVPYSAQSEVADKIREVSTQKVVVSIANPGSPEEVQALGRQNAAENLQQLLPLAKVVKAFDTVTPAMILSASASGKKIELPVAGNDSEAIEAVKDLARIAGFQPVFAGGLYTGKSTIVM